MQTELKRMQTFRVAGLAVRTNNSDEFDPTKAQIPNLWNAVTATKVLEKVPNQPFSKAVYAVYSHYESDASGEYDLTVGALIDEPSSEFTIDEPSSEFRYVDIFSGVYLVFQARG